MKPFFRHFHDSSVLWSWAFNGVRMTSGVILLPILLRKLGNADLGMFWIFASIAQLVPIVDFGFSVSIGRFASYAMGGAEDVKSQGIGTKTTNTNPNYKLLWGLLFTTRRLYLWLALLALILVGLFGTIWVGARIEETSHPQQTWIAWAIVLLAMVLEVYFSWWSTFLNGMNEVAYSARVGALANVLKLVIAAALLLAGLGLLSLPVASLISSSLQRYAARRRCLQLLYPPLETQSIEIKPLLMKLWPNSWRLGIQMLSSYFRTSAPLLICTKFFDLETNGTLGLSLYLASMIQGLSCVWTQVKWPAVGQCLIRHDYASVQSILRPRFRLQFVTFSLLSIVLISICPFCIHWFSNSKTLLPLGWLFVVVLNSGLELHFTFWTTLLSMENRLPYLWPTVATNIASLVLAVLLVKLTSLHLGALILAPLLVSGAFNYWYWAIVGAVRLKTTWRNFVFRSSNAPICACQTARVDVV